MFQSCVNLSTEVVPISGCTTTGTSPSGGKDRMGRRSPSKDQPIRTGRKEYCSGMRLGEEMNRERVVVGMSQKINGRLSCCF